MRLMLYQKEHVLCDPSLSFDVAHSSKFSIYNISLLFIDLDNKLYFFIALLSRYCTLIRYKHDGVSTPHCTLCVIKC